MESNFEEFTKSSNFLHQTSLGLAVIALVILTPFSINNFIQERFLLGIGSAAIIIILFFTAWSIIKYGHYYPLFLFLCLTPALIFFLYTSINDQGLIGVFWCYPALISLYFMLPERKAWLANSALLLILSPKIWLDIEHPLALRIMMTMLGVSGFSALFVKVITNQQKELQMQIIIDPLTEVFNRKLLEVVLKEAIMQNKRTDIPMSLLAVDLDHFKKINDKYGHDAGDKVLQEIGKLLKKRCRQVDKVFRLGGEEFLVFLYGTDLKDAQIVAEELRSTIASQNFIPEDTVTASIGVAELREDEDWNKWLKLSDEKMYLAKANGRNRVEI